MKVFRRLSWPFGPGRAKPLRRRMPAGGVLLGRLRAAGAPYSRMERYRDFKAVFTGHSTPEQGQRVLSQICRWGGLYAPVHVSGDAYATHTRAGAQELCQRIVSNIHVEPAAMPERADGVPDERA
ncbi:MAG: hypothetical protein ACE5FR_10815 [Rhodospirillales bacterium]